MYKKIHVESFCKILKILQKNHLYVLEIKVKLEKPSYLFPLRSLRSLFVEIMFLEYKVLLTFFILMQTSHILFLSKLSLGTTLTISRLDNFEIVFLFK